MSLVFRDFHCIQIPKHSNSTKTPERPVDETHKASRLPALWGLVQGSVYTLIIVCVRLLVNSLVPHGAKFLVADECGFIPRCCFGIRA